MDWVEGLIKIIKVLNDNGYVEIAVVIIVIVFLGLLFMAAIWVVSKWNSLVKWHQLRKLRTEDAEDTARREDSFITLIKDAKEFMLKQVEEVKNYHEGMKEYKTKVDSIYVDVELLKAGKKPRRKAS